MTVFMFIFNTRSDRRCGHIPNATSIEGHVNDFLFDARFMCFVCVGQLKATFTGFTFVAGSAAGRLAVRLITVRAEPFTPNSILVATVAARNDESYHTVRTKSPRLRHNPTKKQTNTVSLLSPFIHTVKESLKSLRQAVEGIVWLILSISLT